MNAIALLISLVSNAEWIESLDQTNYKKNLTNNVGKADSVKDTIVLDFGEKGKFELYFRFENNSVNGTQWTRKLKIEPKIDTRIQFPFDYYKIMGDEDDSIPYLNLRKRADKLDNTLNWETISPVVNIACKSVNYQFSCNEIFSTLSTGDYFLPFRIVKDADKNEYYYGFVKLAVTGDYMEKVEVENYGISPSTVEEFWVSEYYDIVTGTHTTIDSYKYAFDKNMSFVFLEDTLLNISGGFYEGFSPYEVGWTLSRAKFYVMAVPLDSVNVFDEHEFRQFPSTSNIIEHDEELFLSYDVYGNVISESKSYDIITIGLDNYELYYAQRSVYHHIGTPVLGNNDILQTGIMVVGNNLENNSRSDVKVDYYNLLGQQIGSEYLNSGASSTFTVNGQLILAKYVIDEQEYVVKLQ